MDAEFAGEFRPVVGVGRPEVRIVSRNIDRDLAFAGRHAGGRAADERGSGHREDQASASVQNGVEHSFPPRKFLLKWFLSTPAARPSRATRLCRGPRFALEGAANAWLLSID